MSHHTRRVRPTVLYQDEHLLALDKPSGLIFGPGNADAPGLPDAAITAGLVEGDEPFLTVHRYDPDISGVVLYARTPEAQLRLSEAFQTNTVTQRFVALVRGFVAGDGRIDLSMYFDKRTRRWTASARRGEPCLTEYRVLERVIGNTWLECTPVRGRADQIRIHLAAIDHPLTIDPVHGASAPVMLSQYKSGYRPSKRRPERPLIDRMTMHARMLEFEHPLRGERIAIEAPLPKDLRATLRQLGALMTTEAQ